MKFLKRLLCKLRGKGHSFGCAIPIVGARNKYICSSCGKEKIENALPNPPKFSKEFNV